MNSSLSFSATAPASLDPAITVPRLFEPPRDRMARETRAVAGRLETHAHGQDPAQRYHLYLPTRRAVDAPIFVSVHGVSRNAEEHARLLAPWAERAGMVLVAPHFPADTFPDYQRLGCVGRGRRADLALERILRQVALRTGAAAHRLALFGYAGGAEFVHRFVMAHPQRVMAAVVASAGWYTFPDLARAYPLGIRAGRRLPDVHFDPQEFLRVPIAVVVGERDLGRDGSLRHSRRLDHEQGRTRVERARRWVDAMREAAERYGIPAAISFRTLSSGDHSFAKSIANDRLADTAFSFLSRFTWRPVDWHAGAAAATAPSTSG